MKGYLKTPSSSTPPSSSSCFNNIYIKGTVSVILSDTMQRWQCPIYNGKLCLIKYEIGKNVFFCFFKLFIFICGFLAKITCAFLALKKQWRNSQKKEHFSSQLNDCIYYILIRERFQGYHAYTPFNLIYTLKFNLI